MEHPISKRVSDDEFDLDIRVRVSTRPVDKFGPAGDTDSCASTCGDECSNSCASTCEGGCTDTCQTCGSCTSECGGGETDGGCREVRLFEDMVEIEINQLRPDGVTRKIQRQGTIRRVEP